VDRNAALIAEARKRAAGSGLAVEFRVGDIAHLDFAEHTFDGTRAERLFEHLAQPQQALAELVRVTRSGGHIVLASPDMDTNLIDHPDRDLTRKIRHFESDRRPTGLAGQQLYGLMRGAGLTEITTEGIVLTSTDYEETMSSSQLRERAERAQAAGVITPEEQRRWLEGLARYGAADRFFLATTYFIVSGRKP
jgi:SAM-dependent methyltransferase